MLYYRRQIEKYTIRHFSSKMISWNFVNGVIDMVFFRCNACTVFHPMLPHPFDILIFTIPCPIKRIYFGA